MKQKKIKSSLKILQKITLFFTFFIITMNLKAQFEIVPNQNYYQEKNKSNRLKTPPILTLPVFDDFSNYVGKADTTIWQPQQGTFINQNFGINPISVGVATFDGLNQNGQPYNFSNVVVEATGLADQLTSYVIDLSANTPADSVYLSFYYQRSGRGEMPDVNDSLVVQFKRNDNTWVSVWKATGGANDNIFAGVSLALKNPNYFFAGFQFRIQAFGRLSGMYDAWNVDYVYLDKNRRNQNFRVEEITASKNFKGLLKRYTSIPIKHFWADIPNQLNSIVESSINNLSGTGFDVISYKCEVRDTLNNNALLGTLVNVTPFILGGTAQQVPMTAPIVPTIFPTTKTKLGLKTQFIINSGDNSTTIQGVDLKRNDTIKSYNQISDFFAYDDGSAEYGAGINQRFGRVAVRFSLSEPDTLTDIKIHLTKFEKDLSSQTFNLLIWRWIADGNQIKDSILYKVNVPIRYPTRRNQLLSVQDMKRTTIPNFWFPKIILPAGDFLIGWEQTSNDRLTVGLDFNNDASPYTWFNAGNQWLNWQPSDNEKGSLLIRPIFSKDIPTAFEPENITKNWTIYPNPAQDFIHLSGELPEKIIIIDALGKTYFEKNIEKGFTFETIDVSTLKDGIYFVKGIFNKNQFYTKKIIINKK
ncbi:MAG: T9SS C-terminal target domain-containing protein [Bacteroidetes bacterium]|nr:MAG: T9SS C-terminal target domain-containing protein [Bacteroidota bacterium]TAG86953.1 MAG: T9SS C-terminal target domain-containing protein [Bacteroidota bacterium]